MCCDSCSSWYHVPCLFLPDQQLAVLDTEQEFYCQVQGCVDKKTKVLPLPLPLPLHCFVQEFDLLRRALSLKVEALATVQSEFGGVTIPR